MSSRPTPGYALVDAPFDSLMSHRFTHPAIGRAVPGKLFLREPLGLTGAEVSLNRLPAGTAVPFLHSHRVNEEIYIVVAGDGEFQLGDELVAVRPGSVLRVDPATARSWRSIGPAPLDTIVIQVPANRYEGAGAIDDGVKLPQPPAWSSGG